MFMVIWVIVTGALAVISFLGAGLWWAGGGFVTAGLSGSLLLGRRYVLGLLGLGITAVIFLASNNYEPGWVIALENLLTLR